jgi:hypothetical protein
MEPMKVIAVRELKYNSEIGEHLLVVKLGEPRPDDQGQDWMCSFQIGERRNTAYGVDSFQALMLALQMLSAELNHLKTKQKLDLKWLGMDNLGF